MMQAFVLISLAVLPIALGGLVQIQIKAKGAYAPLCLDLNGGKTDNGTPIDVWTCGSAFNPVKGQQWYFDPGTFKLRSSLDENKCIDAGDVKQGSLLQISDCNINAGQFFGWDAKTSTIYLYSTKNQNTMCVDVKDATFKDGTPLQVWKCDGYPNQEWTISVPPPPPKPFKIQVNGQNKCLDLYGQKTDNGTPIDIWDCSGGKGQQWYFQPNSYKIQSVIDPKKCIDASSMKLRNTLTIWDCNALPQQEFGYDQSKGAIFLGKDTKSEDLCMCLTDFKNGSPIQLYTCNGQGTEKWTFTEISYTQFAAPETTQAQLV